jgi:hypothetical protein
MAPTNTEALRYLSQLSQVGGCERLLPTPPLSTDCTSTQHTNTQCVLLPAAHAITPNVQPSCLVPALARCRSLGCRRTSRNSALSWQESSACRLPPQAPPERRRRPCAQAPRWGASQRSGRRPAAGGPPGFLAWACRLQRACSAREGCLEGRVVALCCVAVCAICCVCMTVYELNSDCEAWRTAVMVAALRNRWLTANWDNYAW